jgi:hypothetical protein
MASIKKGLANLGLAAFTIFLVLILAEGALRLTPYKTLLSFSRSHVPQYYYRTDPAMGYDIKENFPKTTVVLDDGVAYPIWSNEIGCFDKPYNGEKNFLLLVGDSFTHAFAPFQDKWGTQAQSLLGTRVLKCGVSGYGTRQASLKADSTCARVGRSPGLIIVGYTMNDFIDDYLFPQYSVTEGYFYIMRRLADPKTGDISTRVRSHAPLSVKIWLKQHSITYNLAENALTRMSPAGEERVIKTPAIEGECSDTLECKYPWLKKAWEAHFESIRSVGKLQHGGGAKALFVIIPVKEQVYPFLISGNDPAVERKYAIILENMKKEGIEYLDLLPLFRKYADQTPRTRLDPKKDLYWPVDGHFSIPGNHLAGLLVSEYILEKNLVSVADRQARLTAIREKLGNFRNQQ